MDTQRIFATVLLVSISLCAIAAGQDCTTFADCRSCIQSTLFCKWCADANVTGRCIQENEDFQTCSDVQHPLGNVMNVENQPVSDNVQISPQRISLSVRPGEPQSFRVSVRPAPTFPLDVYFLMDFSASMDDDLSTLQSIAGDIAQEIGTITSNFSLGFGSFVDKPTAPYINTRPDRITHPCDDGEQCDPPYSYRHHLNLTGDADAFREAVNSLIISGNLDSPEGGIDGMLQAVVCDDIIGWRGDPARRLLVYMTDAGFHFGSDGKIGGALTPHDGKCHLRKEAGNSFYEYEESLRLDYPSISMVNNLMLEKGISPVFLATSSEQQLYRDLRNVFDNVVVGLLDDNSQNLVSALNTAYNELASRVRLFADTIPGVQVTFKSTCRGTSFPDPSGGCRNVGIGTEVEVDVEVEVTQCTPELIQGTSFLIRTSIFGDITVDISGVCSCDCETTPMMNSTTCSNQGDLVCGLCECNNGRLGDSCECTDDGSGNPNLVCMNGPNGLPCSGSNAGDCVCGQCRCREGVNNNPDYRYFGTTCECNNFQCGVDTRGRLCSGSGECTCNGICVCNEGFSGDICECRPLEECRKEQDEDLCSGKGTCRCGICSCDEGYGGQFCDLCTNAEICGTEQCFQYGGCTSCLFSIVGQQVVTKTLEECSGPCASLNISTVTIDFQDNDPLLLNATTAFSCVSETVEGECSGVSYVIALSPDRSSSILARNSPSRCATQIPAWIIAVPIVIGLFILGIIIIVLAKIILLLLDRYEYQQFKKEVASSKFGASVNPIYNSANQEFQNPAYGGY